MSLKLASRFALVLLFGSMLAACGDTWSGLKKDTGENMQAAGDTVSDAGEEVEDEAE